MIEMFWWKSGIDIARPRSVLRAVKRRLYFKLPFSFANFGDELSPAIVAALSQDEIAYSERSGKLLCLGSIFHYANPGDAIWGTGLLKGDWFPRSTSVEIHAVRGPLTERILNANGFDCPKVYGDPAVVSPYLWKADGAPKYKIGIVPHWSHYRLLKNTGKDPSIKLINVSDHWKKVVEEIQQCEVILSSSLHGIILSDAYDIPRIAFYLDTPPDNSWFKFEDYSGSINADFEPHRATGAAKDFARLSEKATTHPVARAMVRKLLRHAPFKVAAQVWKSID